VDVEELMKEDENNQNSNEQKPYRFGYAIDCEY